MAESFSLTVPASPENAARWGALAPRSGHKPATVTLSGRMGRYIVRSVELAGDVLTVGLVAHIELAAAGLDLARRHAAGVG